MYETLGYHRAGLRRAYYHDGEDALVMTKDLER
jgi:ribosomal protein S18 acetylase RimI-like enzyme